AWHAMPSTIINFRPLPTLQTPLSHGEGSGVRSLVSPLYEVGRGRGRGSSHIHKDTIMDIPLSWLKEFVNLDGIEPERIAARLTQAGIEADSMRYIGLPQTQVEGIRMPKSDHLVWDREK